MKALVHTSFLDGSAMRAKAPDLAGYFTKLDPSFLAYVKEICIKPVHGDSPSEATPAPNDAPTQQQKTSAGTNRPLEESKETI